MNVGAVLGFLSLVFLTSCLQSTLSAVPDMVEVKERPAAQAKTPAWLQTIIKDDAKKSLNHAVQEIWQISYRSEIAYFMVSPCCDQYNPLLNAAGQTICNPSGGMTGRGDGKCPTPADAGTRPVLIWSHPQSHIKQPDASYLINNDQNSGTSNNEM